MSRYPSIGGIISNVQKHPTRRRRIAVERGSVLWLESEDDGMLWLQVHEECGSDDKIAMLHMPYEVARAIVLGGAELIELLEENPEGVVRSPRRPEDGDSSDTPVRHRLIGLSGDGCE